MPSLLTNEHELRDFARSVLPELEKDEVLFSCLLARKKYGENIHGALLNRKIFTHSDVEYVVRAVDRLTCFNMPYVDRVNNVEYPSSALVAYINLSPKSMLKAGIRFSNEFLKLVEQALHANMNDDFLNRVRALERLFFISIDKSNSSKIYFLIDVDEKDEALLERVIEAINGDHEWISETRGGYHVLLKRDKMTRDKYHQIQELTKKYGDAIELKNDPVTPIPGTLQGGFIVKRMRAV